MKKFCVFIACLVLVGINLVQAQTVRITGTVTGKDDGLPIPGVSVVVKGTTTGGITNIDGKYELNATTTATTLTFSFVGMKTQEVEIGGRAVINVVLESESLQVEELVVTALGIKREKKALGYTVQEVSGESLTKSGNSNVISSLSGKIAGVEVRQSSGMPGAPSQVFIRGARSFSGSNEPLYVVDGMPISSESDYGSNVTGSASSNRASDIDPNDIESINVLKGQAATALYGMRASNGVIIITTKKGKTGANGQLTVSYTSNFTIDKVSILPEVQTKYAQGSGGVFKPAQSYTWGPEISTLPDNATYGGNGNGNPGLWFDPYKAAWVEPKAYNNPKKYFDQNGYTYNNSVNISNSTEKANYSIGFGSSNQTGIIDRTGMDRYTGKMAGDFKLNEKWNMGFSGNYSDQSMRKLPSGNDSWLFTIYGAPASYDLMGSPFHNEGTLGDYRQISYRKGTVGINPRWATIHNHYDEATKRFFGNTYFEFNPAPWAKIKYQVGADMYTTNNEIYKEMGMSDFASTYPTPTKPNYTYVEPTGGSIDNYGITKRVINSLLTASFTHRFTEDINSSLLLGNEIDDNSSQTYEAYGSGFTTPGWNNLNNTTTQYSFYNKYHRRTAGFFGNLNLDYKSMLFLNVTSRYDIISSMPSNSRSFFYPSVSLGFVFTELNVLKSQKILSFGKVRASYAQVGQAADTYNGRPVYTTGGGTSGFLSYYLNYPVGGISGYKLSSTLYDPNLKPQNTATEEVGVELKFLNNRIGVDYSFYYQDATDQIFPVPMAGSTGYSSMVMNAGEMTAQGHEIILTARPVEMKQFTWDFTLNFTRSVNKVKKLAEGVESINLGGYTTPNIRASAGDTYPSIYGEDYLRDAKGNIVVDAAGMPQVGDFKKIGDVSPKFIVGFTNSFTILNAINISAQIDWKQGGKMYSGTNRLMDLYGTSKRTENRTDPFVVKGVKADGTVNDIATKDYQGYYYILGDIPKSAIYETSFVKIRELSVTFSIPKKYIAPLKLQRAAIGFVTRNILLWSPLPNFDPEASQGQGNMAGGMDYMSLPQTTSYGFNLNLTF